MFHLTTALDAASTVPLYEQLYESLAEEMRTGAIPAGTRMPGKRRLAAEHGEDLRRQLDVLQTVQLHGALPSRCGLRPHRPILSLLYVFPWKK